MYIPYICTPSSSWTESSSSGPDGFVYERKPHAALVQVHGSNLVLLGWVGTGQNRWCMRTWHVILSTISWNLCIQSVLPRKHLPSFTSLISLEYIITSIVSVIKIQERDVSLVPQSFPKQHKYVSATVSPHMLPLVHTCLIVLPVYF